MKPLLGIAALAMVSFNAMAGWSYSTETDKMTSKETVTALIESSNSLSLDFPYSGKNFGNLLVRRHPTLGLDVLLLVDKGQISCPAYNGCSVTVRFDDKPPVKYSAIGAADGDSKLIFLRNANGFINAAKQSKKILVQVLMYQSGAPVFEFQTPEPLVWGTSAKKPTAK